MISLVIIANVTGNQRVYKQTPSLISPAGEGFFALHLLTKFPVRYLVPYRAFFVQSEKCAKDKGVEMLFSSLDALNTNHPVRQPVSWAKQPGTGENSNRAKGVFKEDRANHPETIWHLIKS